MWKEVSLVGRNDFLPDFLSTGPFLRPGAGRGFGLGGRLERPRGVARTVGNATRRWPAADVSTGEHNVDLQTNALIQAGCSISLSASDDNARCPRTYRSNVAEIMD